ncbi:MAG: glycosyltransferase family 9 protein [Pseudobdellovibrionaceae bacterium]|jgi:lipopolysaccharide export system permease protein|nr:glycosyltransferase family 9 protein [Pseudobdellovibrionaceae bacterium]
MLLIMHEKILFITSSRIGDAVLSNGILNYLLTKYPDSRLTVACGPLVVSLYEGVPQLEQIISMKKQSWNRHWIGLWKVVGLKRWDIVVDLRDSAVSRMIFAKHRYILSHKINKSAHKSQQNAFVLGISEPPATRMWFSKAQQEKAVSLIPDGQAPVLGIGPTANWIGKTWPVANFKELTARLLSQEGPFAGWRVAVFAAPGEEGPARQLLDSLPEGVGLDLIAKGTPGEAAACLARCRFYIGNDSGLMHAAAAAGVPTLGLFGASYPEIYAPFGACATYVRTPETFDELTAYEGYSSKTLTQSLMGSLSVDAVYKAVCDLNSQRIV